MSASIIAFLLYTFTAVILLSAFMFIYEKFTPYREFDEIKNNNIAAAITFGGAILGFTFPIVSAIYFTHSLPEMLLWGVITGILQLALFGIMRGSAEDIKAGKVAPAILLAVLSIAIGLLNAVSISA